MPSKLKLTLACGDYEIVRPLKEGRVEADGIDLTILTKPSSRDRQIRIDRNAECDAGEFNMCGYFVSRDQGHPYIALPIFLHRRFRHGFVFVNTSKGIKKASDLKGKKIGCFGGVLAAACTWLRGILSDEYGVSYKDVTWYTDFREPNFPERDGLDVRFVPESPSIEERLLSGEMDAMISPGYPKAFLAGDKRTARLFPDFAAEEISYYKKTKIFPIMHTLLINEDLVAKHPWVAGNLAFAFNEAKKSALQHLRNPRILPIAFYTSTMEEQESLLGPDPWQYGLNDINRNNADTVLRYAHEQGLISRKPDIADMFYPLDEITLSGLDSI